MAIILTKGGKREETPAEIRQKQIDRVIYDQTARMFPYLVDLKMTPEEYKAYADDFKRRFEYLWAELGRDIEYRQKQK